MKICKNCKTELEDNHKFCYRCGCNEFVAAENVTSENEGENSVQSENENVIETPQSDAANNSDDNLVVTVVDNVVDNNVVKKAKNKKKFVKIAVSIVAVIVLIVASLGIFSFVNYMNYRPYREMLGKLESNHFIYYQEYDEISSFDFAESEAGLNFFEKLLNIRKVCEVSLEPHIYFLYDKESVEDNEDLYDLIAEEEDEEIYDDMPEYGELVIADNGDAKIVCGNETLFNINFDSDKKIVSVTYNEDDEYKNAGIDKELGDKYASMIKEHLNYVARCYNTSDILTAAQYVSMTTETERAVWGFELDINDFVNNCYEDPEIEVEPDRTDENLYYITVSGNCSYYDNRWFADPFITRNATVVFCYDEEMNECWVGEDNDNAFYFYRVAKQN